MTNIPTFFPVYSMESESHSQPHAFVINMHPTFSTTNMGAGHHGMGSVLSAMLGSLAGGTLQDPLVRVLQASLNQPSRARRPSPDGMQSVFNVCLRDGECVDCPIGSDSLRAGEWASRMPCGHYFSQDALKEWLSGHNTCPVCRYELPTGILDFLTSKLHFRNSNSAFSFWQMTKNTIGPTT
jgi:hypothetical protein